MLDLQPSSFEAFEREARQGNVVPVVRSVLADLHTPVGTFMRIAGDSPYAFLLESVEGGERIARYSFLGAEPEMIVRGKGMQTFVERDGKTESIRPSQLNGSEITFTAARWRAVRDLCLLPVAQWVISVTTRRSGLNRLCDTITRSHSMRQLMLSGCFIALSSPSIVSSNVWRSFRSFVLKKQAAVPANCESFTMRRWARTKEVEKKIFDAKPLPTPVQSHVENISLQSNWTRRAFEEGVRHVKDYIAAGDCYQVVLSQRFSAQFRGEPLQIYRALRAINPSPYMFFLRLGDETVVGASPEMLVRCHGQRLDYRPIAGTRKRGATETEDWMLSEDLRTDEKEIAEHMMLVDLGRNDLGRVSDYGSVKVEDLMRVERYSHVQHLETSLRSRLRDGLDRFDALASCFPAGTVTGAPKIRAMEIIRALEPDRRGIYAGSVLYMDYADNLDSCIAIRTIVLRNGEALVQAGAGIVADSIPEHEYAETVNKARAMFRAIEMAQRGF